MKWLNRLRCELQDHIRVTEDGVTRCTRCGRRRAEPGARLVLVSDELFRTLGAERVDWGEPDRNGVYTPTLYRDFP